MSTLGYDTLDSEHPWKGTKEGADMESVAKRFNLEMQSALDYSGVWLPNKLLLPGDVCTFREGQLQRTTSLSVLGVTAETRDLQHIDDIYWETPGSLDIDIGANADAKLNEQFPSVEANTRLRFRCEFAVVMHLADVRGQELEDLKQIEQALIERYHRHAWDLSDFFVIETLVSGRSAIIVANSKHASATLGLSVSIPETLPTDVRGNLALASRITNTKGVAFHSITNTEVTPLVRLARLVDPLLGKPRLKMKSPTSGVYEQPFLETGIDYTSS